LSTELRAPVSYSLRPVPGSGVSSYVHEGQKPIADSRAGQIAAALRLVTVSVVFGILSGAVSIITGLQDHSLGVFAIGLGEPR
jgi:hypothetical protein